MAAMCSGSGPQQAEAPDAATLEGFRRAQKLAFDCVTEVGAQLYVGISEAEAAEMLRAYLEEAGCDRFLHRPFAGFGEHARFDGYQGFGDFHPSERRLAAGEAAILDVSPFVDGYCADVGYSLALGENELLDLALSALRQLRAELPGLFESERSLSDIWDTVDKKLLAAGFDNIHARYPFSVLGHRVFKVKRTASRGRRIPIGALGWFSLEANASLFRQGPEAVLTPDNEGAKEGLWAIEPHIGWDGGGAKFEEILVVEQGRAFWLSDDVPHLRNVAGAQELPSC